MNPSSEETNAARVDDLRGQIKGGRVVAVVGAGVSMAATGGAKTASWRGLLESGIDHCAEWVEDLPPDWADRVRQDANSDDIDDLLAAASKISGKLGAPHGGEFRNWLRKSIGNLSVSHPDVIEALASLKIPIATTNYDSLLEKAVTGSQPFTWRDVPAIQRALRRRREETDHAIIHLHGHWQWPETVVLGLRSYVELLGQGASQALLQALRSTYSFLYIGYGAGLQDPNFASLLRWARETFAGTEEYRHYRLVRESEVESVRQQHQAEDRIFVVSYGKEHEDLAPFLLTLAPGAAPAEKPRPRKRTRAPDVAGGATSEEIRRYLGSLIAAYETVPLAGFETRVRVPIQLEELYVPLQAVPDLHGTGEGMFADAEDAFKKVGREAGEREIPLAEAFQAADRLGHRRGVVILGDPGSGKTTHLKRLLLWVARREPAFSGLPEEIIPVFLPLRDLREHGGRLDAFVEAQLDEYHHLAEPGFGRRVLRDGRLLFLLDGLDEVPDEKHRGEVAAWIDKALVDYPESRFVVTCRYAGYGGKVRLSEKFLELHLRPLGKEQAESFVRNWYRIVETSLSPDQDRALAEAEQQAEALWSRLQEPDFRARRVFELTRNPLLLTAICLVHRDRGRLPNRRAELYDECVNVLLERWRESKKLGVTVGAKEARLVLQPMAYWLHAEEGRTRATAEELAPVVAPLMRQIRRAEDTPEAFLKTIRDESGLLTGWSDESYGFLHLGFQEYLAAREIRSRAFQDNAVIAQLASHFGESWWREVSLLLLALGDPPLFEPFMREVLKQPNLAKHADLVDECLDDSLSTVPGPFVDLVQRKPGRSRDLWARQLLALRVLERSAPETLDTLLPALEGHPSKEIRALVRKEPGVEVIAPEPSGYELVRIPAGTFKMGSVAAYAHKDERPVREVTLDSFYLGKYAVTNEEYGRFLAGNPGAAEPKYWGDRKYNQPRQPVVGVSWDEAQAYCKWAGLELPTEAQWEYACRAGAQTRYWSGDSEEELAEVGWYKENSGGRLHPVGEKPANRFGLCDMHGNVWEWCRDPYTSYEKDPRPGDGLRDDRSAGIRVLRGGSFGFSAGRARSAYRSVGSPDVRWSLGGFRPARRITTV